MRPHPPAGDLLFGGMTGVRFIFANEIRIFLRASNPPLPLSRMGLKTPLSKRDFRYLILCFTTDECQW